MFTNFDNKALALWSETVRDIFILNTPPLTGVDDPRVKFVMAESAFRGTPEAFVAWYNPEGENFIELQYFRLVYELPSPPIHRPEWAHEVTTRMHHYPEVTVTYRSKEIQAGNIIAQWEQFVTVTVDLDVWPNGQRIDPEGLVEASGLCFSVCIDGQHLDIEPANPEQIQLLGETLLKSVDAFREQPTLVRRLTEPGEPEQHGIGGGL